GGAATGSAGDYGGGDSGSGDAGDSSGGGGERAHCSLEHEYGGCVEDGGANCRDIRGGGSAIDTRAAGENFPLHRCAEADSTDGRGRPDCGGGNFEIECAHPRL